MISDLSCVDVCANKCMGVQVHCSGPCVAMCDVRCMSAACLYFNIHRLCVVAGGDDVKHILCLSLSSVT